jgi:hypothetical protein
MNPKGMNPRRGHPMVIKTVASAAQELDAAILEIQRQSNPDKQMQMLNSLLTEREPVHRRIAVSLSRHRNNGTPIDEIVQAVRETAMKMILGNYKPFCETIRFDHQLLVKSGDRVLMLRRQPVNNVASRMTNVASASLRYNAVADELATMLKRTPTTQEIKQRYLDLYGSDVPSQAQIADVTRHVEFDHNEAEAVSATQHADQPDIYGAMSSGEDHWVAAQSSDGSKFSIEMSDVIEMILAEARQQDNGDLIARYLEFWLMSVANGEPPSDRTQNVAAKALGVPYREFLRARPEERRLSILQTVLGRIGAN